MIIRVVSGTKHFDQKCVKLSYILNRKIVQTHQSDETHELTYDQKLSQDVNSFLPSKNPNKIMELENNDKYAAAMAGIHYMRVAAPLPKAGDVIAQANYWKQYYNTSLGKGKPHEYVEKWKKYVLGVTP